MGGGGGGGGSAPMNSILTDPNQVQKYRHGSQMEYPY